MDNRISDVNLPPLNYLKGKEQISPHKSHVEVCTMENVVRLSECISEFVIVMKADGLAKTTISNYQRNLTRLRDFLHDPDVRSITTNDLRRFLADYREDHSMKSVYNVWVTFRSLWRYLEELNVENVANRLRKPRFPTAPIIIPTKDDIIRLIEACEYTAPSNGVRKSFRMLRPTAKRDKAIIMLLVDTGMRSGEAAALQVSDIDMKTGHIQIRRGKGGKARIVYASRPTLDAIREYWNKRRIRPTEPAFTTKPGRPLTTHQIHHLIVGLSTKAGTRLHPHTLRHFFATQYLRNGGNMFSLKDILGHSTLKMVEYYVHLVDADIQESHHQASPMLSVLKTAKKGMQ